MRDLPNITTSGDDLLPLADPRRVGLPFSRRTLGDRIVAKKFPPVIRIGGRLYIQRSELEQFKAKLIADGGERLASRAECGAPRAHE